MNIIRKKKDGNKVKRKNSSLELHLTRPKRKKEEKKKRTRILRKKKANDYNRFVKQWSR